MNQLLGVVRPVSSCPSSGLVEEHKDGTTLPCQPYLLLKLEAVDCTGVPSSSRFCT